MRTVSRRLAVLALAIAPSVLLADIIPTGFVSWNVNFPGNTGEFTISNMTGPNGSAFPDTSFPVATSLSYSGLSLQVDFSDSSSQTFGSSYFTLSPDGLSFNGNSIPIGGANPFPTDALLTGSFSPTNITLNDGALASILDSFSAEILPSSGINLGDGDFAVINATTGTSAVPEPASVSWMLAGIFAVSVYMRSKRSGILLHRAKGSLSASSQDRCLPVSDV